MKIYWTRAAIPELAGLSPAVRNKNFKNALRAAHSHFEYWLGVALALAASLAISIALRHVHTDALAGLRGIPGLVVGLFIWQQSAVYTIRKYYPHILRRGRDLSAETAAEKLIREADDDEYASWRFVRYGLQIGLLIAVIILAIV